MIIVIDWLQIILISTETFLIITVLNLILHCKPLKQQQWERGYNQYILFFQQIIMAVLLSSTRHSIDTVKFWKEKQISFSLKLILRCWSKFDQSRWRCLSKSCTAIRESSSRRKWILFQWIPRNWLRRSWRWLVRNYRWNARFWLLQLWNDWINDGNILLQIFDQQSSTRLLELQSTSNDRIASPSTTRFDRHWRCVMFMFLPIFVQVSKV